MPSKRVRVGATYKYDPVPFDRFNPPFGCEKGDVVKVVNLPGCPRANTMGMCYVSKGGKFAGMVCTNSLDSISAREKKGKWAESGKEPTVKEWLQGVADANSSSERDSKMMQSLLRKVGYNNAVVVYGIAYPEGKGRPVSIHAMAKHILASTGDERSEKGSWAKRRDEKEGWRSFEDAERHGYVILVDQPFTYRLTEKGKKRKDMDRSNAKRRAQRFEQSRIKRIGRVK